MAQQNQSNWEADKMLDVYIHDYLMKKKLHNTAKSFMTEGKVSPDPVAIDAPGGFLFEWWSVFWDIFIARTNEKHSEAAAAYIEAQQTKAREQQQQQQQQLQLQQLQLMRQAQLQRRDPAQPSLVGPTNASNSEGMLGQSTASAIAAKLYEERLKLSNPVDSPGSQPLLDPRMALLKSGHPSQLVQGNSGSVTAALHQMQDIKGDVNMGGNPRSLPMNPSSIYGQNIMQPRPGVGNAGLSHGAGDLPLKGWPLTGIDQIRPSLGAQVQKPFLQSANQFQLMQQQQQLLAQVQTQGNLSTSPIFGDMDPRVFRGLPRGALNTKEGQTVTNDGSVGSPMQSSSSKMNMPQMQQSSSQQQQDPLQPQQMQQNNRKRKGLSSSGPANSTGTGNTIGPSPNSQPSTPSTHTPGDGVAMASNVQQASSMSKGLMMYGSNGLGGLTSSANQLDEIDHFGDVGSLDDNVESFLSPDDGDGRDVFAKLKQNPTDHVAETTKDGKYLASAGQVKKAPIKQGKSLISLKNSYIEE